MGSCGSNCVHTPRRWQAKTPTARGLFLWVCAGSIAVVRVIARGEELVGRTVLGSRFYDECALTDWVGGEWLHIPERRSPQPENEPLVVGMDPGLGDDCTVVYAIRHPDGRTQVMAPTTQDRGLVDDILNEALRALHEGKPVTRQ